MIDVHVISSENRHAYDTVLSDYFRQRYRVFVEEKGWRDLRPVDGLEIDQFDDDNAVYAIATDGAGVVGGTRFRPTTSPHMLDTMFAHLAQWPIPVGPDTWEATRYFVRRDRRSGIMDAAMMIAAYQLCIAEGVSQLTGILEMANVSRRMQAGVKVRPLGLPQEVGRETVVAVVAEMSEASFQTVLRKLRAKPVNMVRRGLEVGRIVDRLHAGETAAARLPNTAARRPSLHTACTQR